MMRQSYVLASTFIVSALLALPARADPPTAEVAKMCRQLMVKTYPPQVAGSRRAGNEKAQREYFRDCIEKNSKEQKKN
jgi:hypothetical protein